MLAVGYITWYCSSVHKQWYPTVFTTTDSASWRPCCRQPPPARSPPRPGFAPDLAYSSANSNSNCVVVDYRDTLPARRVRVLAPGRRQVDKEQYKTSSKAEIRRFASSHHSCIVPGSALLPSLKQAKGEGEAEWKALIALT